MISDERLSQAMKYLAETDKQCAELKAEVARKDYICKKTRARIFLLATGNNEERKAHAETSADTENVEFERYNTIAEFEKLRAKRETESLVIEVWRTLSANRRQGGFQ